MISTGRVFIVYFALFRSKCLNDSIVVDLAID